jgi:hypothetical protein
MHEFNYTTSEILKFENAGGILTSGIPLNELKNKPLTEWFKALPLVDTDLVTAWYNLYIARVAMETLLKQLT